MNLFRAVNLYAAASAEIWQIIRNAKGWSKQSWRFVFWSKIIWLEELHAYLEILLYFEDEMFHKSSLRPYLITNEWSI